MPLSNSGVEISLMERAVGSVPQFVSGKALAEWHCLYVCLFVATVARPWFSEKSRFVHVLASFYV